MDFQGDRPNVNDGTLPVCLQKVFDHFTFRAEIPGLEKDRDYTLTVTYLQPDERFLSEHTARVNGALLQKPVRNETLWPPLLPLRFAAYDYSITSAAMPDGTVRLEIEEPVSGFQLAEFRITHREERI